MCCLELLRILLEQNQRIFIPVNQCMVCRHVDFDGWYILADLFAILVIDWFGIILIHKMNIIIHRTVTTTPKTAIIIA